MKSIFRVKNIDQSLNCFHYIYDIVLILLVDWSDWAGVVVLRLSRAC